MLICLTASHKNASFDLLEKLSVESASVPGILLQGNDFLSGAVVVATCNRFEAYLDVDEPLTAAVAVAVEATTAAVSHATGVAESELHGRFEVLCGTKAAEHLFSVTSGLESVVVGEGEIAGQVRRSLESARARGTTSSELERLFQRASQTSRGVKNRTGLGGAGRSLVRLALDLAESRVTDWQRARVLLVGTGRYAGASLAALRDRGVTEVSVYSPSGRAPRFAASHGIESVDAGELAVAAASADLVVTCTTATGFVVDAELLDAGRATLAQHGERRQLVIDLGLPRNVNPDVAAVAGVELLDLETISIHAPLDELQASDDARALVDKAVRKFAQVADEQSLTPAVVALRSHVFDALDAEIERARSRGDADGQTEAALRHLAGVLLHTPMVRARELARAGEQQKYVEALDTLFGLDVTGADIMSGARPAAGSGSAAGSPHAVSAHPGGAPQLHGVDTSIDRANIDRASIDDTEAAS
ncbi:glutamyl-tRNA reductase [Compostimonas suwonensis]|uniref:Glutamyl-tRNA reductase n=1 Tax=Compostimonas suwonensis TaxID=1048394 RepID=A0A2M9C3Y7_9MICO|nr:glutamyl-tRNA reductase [Compostimonas suwonensis]PJJ65241.1 glutamyl-tRNA reductase [Compostimonas suwonensis]